MTTTIKNHQEEIIINLQDTANTVDYIVSEDAKLRLIIFADIKTANNINISLKENALLELIYCSLSSDDNTVMNIYLRSEGSIADIKALIIGNNSSQNLKINTFHQAKNTKSDTYVAAIAANKANVTIRVVSNIENKMRSSDSSQKIVGSMIDNESIIQTEPVLYIDEFDCLAGHATTVGKLDEEALFYLMSRGLTKDEATKILLSAILMPVLTALDNEELKMKIIGMI